MYLQDDKRWARLRWYHPELDEAINAITKAFERSPGVLIGEKGDGSSLEESGCWHTSVASMLTLFGVTYNNKKIDPAVFVEALRNERLGTLSGYVGHSLVDPISILTKSRVFLSSYEDFGKSGVSSNDDRLREMLDTVNGKRICAIVNVNSHEFFGNRDPHYVLAYEKTKTGMRMHDPSPNRIKDLFKAYQKFYQISLYKCACLG